MKRFRRVGKGDDTSALETANFGFMRKDLERECSTAGAFSCLHKRMMWKALDMSMPELVDLETRALHHSMGQQDAIEGGMAYFERRDPKWTSSVSKDWPEWMK